MYCPRIISNITFIVFFYFFSSKHSETNCEVVGLTLVYIRRKLHSSFQCCILSLILLWGTGGLSLSSLSVHPSLWSLATKLSQQVMLPSFNPLRGDSCGLKSVTWLVSYISQGLHVHIWPRILASVPCAGMTFYWSLDPCVHVSRVAYFYPCLLL